MPTFHHSYRTRVNESKLSQYLCYRSAEIKCICSNRDQNATINGHLVEKMVAVFSPPLPILKGLDDDVSHIHSNKTAGNVKRPHFLKKCNYNRNNIHLCSLCHSCTLVLRLLELRHCVQQVKVASTRGRQGGV